MANNIQHTNNYTLEKLENVMPIIAKCQLIIRDKCVKRYLICIGYFGNLKISKTKKILERYIDNCQVRITSSS